LVVLPDALVSRRVKDHSLDGSGSHIKAHHELAIDLAHRQIAMDTRFGKIDDIQRGFMMARRNVFVVVV
jgi:hypothetical protein